MTRNISEPVSNDMSRILLSVQQFFCCMTSKLLSQVSQLDADPMQVWSAWSRQVKILRYLTFLLSYFIRLNKPQPSNPGKGQFNSPHGFCLGLEEEIIVADTNNHRIQVLAFFLLCSLQFQMQDHIAQKYPVTFLIDDIPGV